MIVVSSLPVLIIAVKRLVTIAPWSFKFSTSGVMDAYSTMPFRSVAVGRSEYVTLPAVGGIRIKLKRFASASTTTWEVVVSDTVRWVEPVFRPILISSIHIDYPPYDSVIIVQSAPIPLVSKTQPHWVSEGLTSNAKIISRLSLDWPIINELEISMLEG